MFGLIRTGVSIVVLGVGLWAAFAVDLGGRTFAEHIDTISETPEAEQLIEGTRAKINPALQELRDRVLGEYVEAPTWIPADDAGAGPPSQRERERERAERERSVPASTLAPEQRYEPSLPGRRAGGKAKSSGSASTRAVAEPPLPGQRPASKPSEPTYEPALPGRR